ncbi:PH domain-containing protein [Streptomyces sp. NPDC059552]|uniref:PH domain-containing protein n=1 Tax=Streptomyces sp. NPDC059552 TaxID=3346862 RepID=UPI003692A493
MGRTGRVALWLAIALVSLLAGVMSALEVRGALEREREYLASPACASVPVTASACVWEQGFTVRESDLHTGERGKVPSATLLLPDGTPWKVEFRDSEPVASEMRPGDPVVGVVWHGRIVEVRDSGARRQQTTFGPVGWPADRLGGALAFLSFGLIALAGSLWAVVKRGDRRHGRAAAMVRWHGAAVGVTALLTLWAQANNGWPLWVIWAVWGPLTLVLLATMTASAVAALRGAGGYDLFDEPPARPPAAEGGPVPGAGGLPREYRMDRGRRRVLMALLAAKAALLMFMVWTEDIPPLWFQIGLSALMALLLIVFVVRTPRSATLVDSTGIRIRGLTRTRRVAWEEVREIRAQPLRGSDGGIAPRMIAYVYPTNGRRKLLRNLDDHGYDVEREVALLRAALAEHRRTDTAPDVPAA